MKILEHPAELRTDGRPVCAAIGVFDGVHLGHRQVLQQTLDAAEQSEGVAVAITFDDHPARVLAPERAPKMVYPLDKKLALLAKLGFDHTLLIRFTPAIAGMEAPDFVSHLVTGFGRLRGICVGKEFTFGRARAGNVALLQRLGEEHGFCVNPIAAVALDGERVSSTRIRAAIAAGELDRAAQMLGRAHTLNGPVIHGDHLGRKLGFPTANVECANLALPPYGVYAAHAHLPGGSHRAAVNIGLRPTLAEPDPVLHVEAHLPEFAGDLYGQPMELQCVRRLRGEMKFSGLEELQAQIARDVAAVRDAFD